VVKKYAKNLFVSTLNDVIEKDINLSLINEHDYIVVELENNVSITFSLVDKKISSHLTLNDERASCDNFINLICIIHSACVKTQFSSLIINECSIRILSNLINSLPLKGGYVSCNISQKSVSIYLNPAKNEPKFTSSVIIDRIGDYVSIRSIIEILNNRVELSSQTTKSIYCLMKSISDIGWLIGLDLSYLDSVYNPDTSKMKKFC